jgi:hypothetical protein
LMTPCVVIEIVCKSDSVSLCDRQDFVFAITVEGCPLDGGGIFAPVEFNFTTVVTDRQFSSLVCGGETNDQRSELIFSAWSIDMRFKLVMRTLVNLIVNPHSHAEEVVH